MSTMLDNLSIKLVFLLNSSTNVSERFFSKFVIHIGCLEYSLSQQGIISAFACATACLFSFSKTILALMRGSKASHWISHNCPTREISSPSLTSKPSCIKRFILTADNNSSAYCSTLLLVSTSRVMY